MKGESMKRDMNLVVELLKYFEEREEIGIDQNVAIPEYDERQVQYHLRRMFEAGLLDAEASYSTTTKTRIITVYPFGLTWQGHEFLDALRGEGVLSSIKERVGGSIGEIPFSILKELAINASRVAVGL